MITVSGQSGPVAVTFQLIGLGIEAEGRQGRSGDQPLRADQRRWHRERIGLPGDREAHRTWLLPCQLRGATSPIAPLRPLTLISTPETPGEEYAPGFPIADTVGVGTYSGSTSNDSPFFIAVFC
jgi:hypothetical protein